MVNTANSTITDELRILTTSPIHGYGYRVGDFWNALVNHRAHAIIVDAGSTDGGPSCIGLDDEFICSKESYMRDFAPMLEACHHLGVKIMIGSAGGCGDNRSVDHFVNIVREMAESGKYSFKVGTIKTEVPKSKVQKFLSAGEIVPCGPAPELTQEALDSTIKMVAQVGPEPYIKLLKEHPDVDIIIGGRSYDPAPFAALAMHHGLGAANGYAPAWHAGKIMECGGICALPKARSMLAVIRHDHFDLVPLNPGERVTPVSAAAHTLYEKTRPDLLPGPGGKLHLGEAKYEQLPDGRSVRVSGAVYEKDAKYMIKLEGASVLGFRTIFIGGIRDPILIEGIDNFLETTADYTTSFFPELQDGRAKIIWHVYGRNAVMGPLEPRLHDCVPHEVGIMGEVVAPTQGLANAIANNVRVGCLHNSYPGQLATAGNFAIPLTPHEQPAGPVFRFSVYHLMPMPDPADFPTTFETLGVPSGQTAPVDPEYSPKTETVIAKQPKAKLNGNAVKVTKPNQLRYLARVVRSKNSGPFEITCDVMFDSEEMYERAVSSGVLNRELIAKLYNVADEKILTCMFFRPALAWKMTIVRPMEQGSIGETDTFGTAQHAPLLDVELPEVGAAAAGVGSYVNGVVNGVKSLVNGT